MPLLDALLAWRKDAESQAQTAGSEVVMLRKKVNDLTYAKKCMCAMAWTIFESMYSTNQMLLKCRLLTGTPMQLAVETVFLEAAIQLVGPESSGLSDRQAEALERLAFDWALNAETYVDPKFSELCRAREQVNLLHLMVAAICTHSHAQSTSEVEEPS